MKLIALPFLLLLSSCYVGPNYNKPTTIAMPGKFKESNIQWQEAKPNADIDRGEWWKIYNDSILNDLENKLNNKNQNIISAEHSYKAALALVSQARSSYLPTIGATADISKQQEQKTIGNNKTATQISKSHELELSSSWELDLWGNIAYSVESNLAAAKASGASLASTKLSMQASLAQYYFELKTVNQDQQLLDNIVTANKKLLNYNQNRYKAGIANQTDIHDSENNYQTALAAALNNQVTKAQYQHAIAALIGESPSSFSLDKLEGNKDIAISIPLMIPSNLLERRPDIAKSEKLVQQANAEIGSAKTAFFPSLSLAASSSMIGSGLGNLLSMPELTWSLGPQLALGLLDGGARFAQIKYARENYQASVASYRQTVLSAFSEVEDQLVSLKSLNKQVIIQNKNAKNAKNIFQMSSNQYKAGTVDYAMVLNSQISYYNADKIASDTIGSKRIAEIGLIKALGGGWKE